MRPFAVFMILSLGAGPATATDAGPTPAWIEQSRQLATQLGSELKAELGQAIAAGGPVAAIDVCHTRAPQIAARLTSESGAAVGRTSLRVRNPANAPDVLQRTLLTQFDAELASGRFAGPLEAAFEIRRGNQVERHYLRAIPTEPLCLTCHGRTVAPEVAAAIASKYPADQATGYDLGQLRGAFTVTWPATSPVTDH